MGYDNKNSINIRKFVDDILIAGENHEVTKFKTALYQKFEVSRFVINRKIVFYRFYTFINE